MHHTFFIHSSVDSVVVQSISRVQLFVTPWTAPRQASLSITKSRSSLRLTSIELVMPSSYLILCRPLLLLPWICPSIGVFSSESTLHIRWPKDCGFRVSPSSRSSGLISFRIDWWDLLAVQKDSKSLLQDHSWKASVLQRPAFFMVQLSHPYSWLCVLPIWSSCACVLRACSVDLLWNSDTSTLSLGQDVHSHAF